MTENTHRFIQLAGFADKGLLPVAGGVLDQSRSFMDALSFWRAEKARWGAVEPSEDD